MATIDVSRVGSNIGALNSLNSLSTINARLAMHQTRLASGKRINNAADDPAGLTIATKLSARNEGLKIAMDNVSDAKNLLAVAESGMGRINDILVQMRNKAEQAASDTLGTGERDAIVTQLKAFAAQIDDIVDQTKWNGNALIDGDYEQTALTFQTGADKDDTTTMNGMKSLRAFTLGLATVTNGTVSQSVQSVDDSDDDILTVDTAASLTSSTFNSAADALKTGNYTIKVTYSADGADSSLELLDANGNALRFDATGSAGDGDTSVTTKLEVDLDSADKAFDFGNGIMATLSSFASAGAKTATVHYDVSTTGDTYDLRDADDASLTKASSATQFSGYMDKIQSAINTVSQQLTLVGSMAGRLTFKEDQLSAAQINTEAAYNRIMNANMAEEQVNASKYQILQQTATAMLAQANAAPQFLLSLFR